MTVDRTRLMELLDAYLEQRLSADDRAALQAELVRSPEACRVFWECAHQHALLAELLAERQGRRLAAEEMQRARRDVTSASRSAFSTLHSALLPVGLAAAVLLLVALGGLLRQGPTVQPSETAVARLDELRGDVQVLADDGETALPPAPARAGQLLRAGQEVRTGRGSFAVVTYDDNSRLELNPSTAVRLLGDSDDVPPRTGKSFFLVKGALSARVAPQPAGRHLILRTLQADLLAAGTRFSSAIVLGETRIDLEEGRALLAAKGDPRTIEIHTGTYAVSSPEMEVYNPAPLLPASGKPFAVLDEDTGPILSLAPLADGHTLAVGCSSGAVKLWDLRDHRVRASLDADRKRVLALSSALAGPALAVGYEPHKGQRDPSLLVWDTARRRIRDELPGSLRTHALDFTPDGRSVVLAGARGLLVWDLGDRRERLALGDRADRVQCLAVSPDGRHVAAGHRAGRIRLWDLYTGRLELTLEGHTRDVQSLAFRADGEVLASGSRDGSVRLWSPRTGEELRRLTGRFNEVRCLAFAPDGQTLTTGHGGLAILWDTQTGKQRTTLKAHKFAITALAYVGGGLTLATAGWDRCVKLWDLQPSGDGKGTKKVKETTH